jgi:hypothetical protein
MYGRRAGMKICIPSRMTEFRLAGAELPRDKMDFDRLARCFWPKSWPAWDLARPTSRSNAKNLTACSKDDLTRIVGGRFQFIFRVGGHLYPWPRGQRKIDLTPSPQRTNCNECGRQLLSQ